MECHFCEFQKWKCSRKNMDFYSSCFFFIEKMRSWPGREGLIPIDTLYTAQPDIMVLSVLLLRIVVKKNPKVKCLAGQNLGSGRIWSHSEGKWWVCKACPLFTLFSYSVLSSIVRRAFKYWITFLLSPCVCSETFFWINGPVKEGDC